MVEETFEPGMTVSLVARRYGVAPKQLFPWRRLVAQRGPRTCHRVKKTTAAAAVAAEGRFPMKTVAEVDSLLGFAPLDDFFCRHVEALPRNYAVSVGLDQHEVAEVVNGASTPAAFGCN